MCGRLSGGSDWDAKMHLIISLSYGALKSFISRLSAAASTVGSRVTVDGLIASVANNNTPIGGNGSLGVPESVSFRMLDSA
jgi:hypothetical protein